MRHWKSSKWGTPYRPNLNEEAHFEWMGNIQPPAQKSCFSSKTFWSYEISRQISVRMDEKRTFSNWCQLKIISARRFSFLSNIVYRAHCQSPYVYNFNEKINVYNCHDADEFAASWFPVKLSLPSKKEKKNNKINKTLHCNKWSFHSSKILVVY